MAAFTVWKFDNLDGAAHAESVLEDCQAEGFLKVVDHAVVTWPEGTSHPSTSHGNDEKWRGTGWGALWGVLVGALFFVPVVGGVVGAAIGAISKMTEDAGITKEQLETIRTELTPGTSALFVVTERATSTAWASASAGSTASSSPPTSRTASARSCWRPSADAEP